MYILYSHLQRCISRTYEQTMQLYVASKHHAEPNEGKKDSQNGLVKHYLLKKKK